MQYIAIIDYNIVDMKIFISVMQYTAIIDNNIVDMKISISVMQYTAITDNDIVGVNRFINDVVLFKVIFEYSHVMSKNWGPQAI